MAYYKIAGLNVEFNFSNFDFSNPYLEEYKVESFDKADITVKFELNNNINENLPTPFVSKGGRNYFETEDDFGFYDHITEVDKTVTVMRTNKLWTDFSYKFSDLTELFGIDVNTTVRNVAGHLFADGIRRFGGAVLHASTIVYNGKAVTFTAPSGTGKSTHTGLWKKYYPETIIINDDMPAIRCIDGEFRAFGTPWAGKTDINENISAPLHAMVFIERAEECSISPITPMEAVIRMMREVPLDVYKEQSDLLMNFFNKLFTTVPVYLLKCNISKDAVDVVKKELF